MVKAHETYDAILCQRKADMPVPCQPSQDETCSLCGVEVWIGNRTLAVPEAKGVPIWCVQCAAVEALRAP